MQYKQVQNAGFCYLLCLKPILIYIIFSNSIFYFLEVLFDIVFMYEDIVRVGFTSLSKTCLNVLQ